ncbi:MAG TPA: hypothetical protein VF899_10915 [Pyrinomonadaceae bacterium]
MLHSDYEEADLGKLAREVGCRPTHQTDPGKLAREADLSPARDDALVPDQKEHNNDALAV